MQSLLRWGIENTDSGAPPSPAQQNKLDPGVIDMILGKPDSELMKEALSIAVDDKREEDDRLQALDDLEMLVESIDNANDLAKLKMWEPIQNLLTSPSSSEAIKAQTLWVIGTSVQNNPAAQREYLAFSPMETLISFLAPGTGSAKTRSKAVYALSGLLKHHAPAVQQFQEAGGWKTLRDALQDPDIAVRRKVAFLLNALLIPTVPVTPTETQSQPHAAAQGSDRSVVLHPDSTVHSSEPSATTVHPNSHASMLSDPASLSTSSLTIRAMENEGLLQGLLDALTSPLPHGPDGESEGDEDFEAKIVNVLQTYVMSCHGQLTPEQRQTIAAYLQAQGEQIHSEHELADRWGLSTEEIRLFRMTVDRR